MSPERLGAGLAAEPGPQLPCSAALEGPTKSFGSTNSFDCFGCGRLITQKAVRTEAVVVLPPSLDQHRGYSAVLTQTAWNRFAPSEVSNTWSQIDLKPFEVSVVSRAL